MTVPILSNYIPNTFKKHVSCLFKWTVNTLKTPVLKTPLVAQLCVAPWWKHRTFLGRRLKPNRSPGLLEETQSTSFKLQKYLYIPFVSM